MVWVTRENSKELAHQLAEKAKMLAGLPTDAEVLERNAREALGIPDPDTDVPEHLPDPDTIIPVEPVEIDPQEINDSIEESTKDKNELPIKETYMTDLLDKAIDIKGKKYVLVSDRILAFNEIYPNGSITTELLSSPGDDMVVMKATVKIGDRTFCGHSQAKWGDGYINKTSAMENAETSAVGRALAMMGIGVIDSIASVDEVNKAETTTPYVASQSEPINPPTAAQPQYTAPQPAAAPAQSLIQAVVCPKCGSGMWDNRGRKTNPKAPDFKCKDKNCDGAIWPPRR